MNTRLSLLLALAWSFSLGSLGFAILAHAIDTGEIRPMSIAIVVLVSVLIALHGFRVWRGLAEKPEE